jgi:hypothetical protein
VGSFGEPAIENAETLGREPVIVEIKEDGGREVTAALIVDDDALLLGNAPRLNEPLHFGCGNLPAEEAEHVDVHRAGNVPCRVNLRGRSVEQQHVVALQVLLEPGNAGELAATTCCRHGRLREEQAAGDDHQKPLTQMLRHVDLH